MTKKYILIFILLAVLVFVYSYQRNIFTGLDKFRLSNQALTELRLKNQGLEQEIKDLKNKLNLASQPYLSARVYSRYPFNNNQTLIINVGSKDGVKVGWPVLAAEHYLLGKIVEVKTTTSEVLTIFSPDWKSGVKIGQAGIEAVLVGGRPPKLDLIPADAKIKLDDEVLSVSPNLPLNLLVGKISEINSQPTVSLQQAKIRTDYDPNQLDKVFIVTDYEGFD
ncbi:MAG: rod shape-determining protein MreC [Patescibacteria group bacterium]